ncbi:MAG: hypothetical protein DMG12_10650 [Acidobacteria bacterium]|nr:MAG: hypothetical protein DMG12_10650 [Acidobacteriota bacterium]
MDGVFWRQHSAQPLESDFVEKQVWMQKLENAVCDSESRQRRAESDGGFNRFPLMNMNLRHYNYPGKASIIVRARNKSKLQMQNSDGPITFAVALILPGRVHDELLICPEA